MKKNQCADIFIGIVLILLAFLVYLRTIAPSVNWMDSGELATVAATLGVAHPTGYPLFSLIGFVFAHLPIGGRIIWKLNLMAAIACSIAIFFFYRLFLLLLSEKTIDGLADQKVFSQIKSTPEALQPPDTSKRIAAAVAVLILAFSKTYWSQAISIEVYSLHIVFLSLIISIFIQSILNPGSNRIWYIFAFTLGLSFTNHMTTILLAPGFIYLYFSTHGFSRSSWMKIVKAIVPFCIPLALYLYLPLRASQNPVMNWGTTNTFQTFLFHVSGGQYRFEMFSSLNVAIRQAKYFFSTFLNEFGYAPVVFGIFGIGYLFRFHKKLLIFSLLLFLGCLFYSINYDIPDIDSYFLLAYVAVVIWIVFGIRWFLDRTSRWKLGAWILCASLPLLPLCLHYHEVDESRDYSTEDFVKNVLASAEPNAVVFTNRFEIISSPAYYLQLIEGVRPDVVIIDQSLMEFPWYDMQLRRRFPWLIQSFGAESQLYLPEVYRSNHEILSNSPTLDTLEWMRLRLLQKIAIKSLFENSIHEGRPVYVTFDIKPDYYAGFNKIPSGALFRLFYDTIPKVIQRDFDYHPFPGGNQPYVEDIKKNYAIGYFNQGVSSLHIGDTTQSIVFFKRALELRPNLQNAIEYLHQLKING